MAPCALQAGRMLVQLTLPPPTGARQARHQRSRPTPPPLLCPPPPRSYYNSEAELHRIFKSVNGLIFPGGLTDLWCVCGA